MIGFFVALIGRIVAVDLFRYLAGLLLLGGCFRLFWRLVLPRGADDRTPDL